MIKENRRSFIQKFGVISLAAGSGAILPYSGKGSVSSTYATPVSNLKSLPSKQIFSVIDLDIPELKEVKSVFTKRGHDAALKALLSYYRTRYPKPEFKKEESSQVIISRADDLKKHIFRWGPYPAADYGADIDWGADPAGDIEWVAGIQRFSWTNDLVRAYLTTADDSYITTFIELVTDWIIKHPLEKTVDLVHPVYKEGVYGKSGWRGYAWLDLQTGIRATNICGSFKKIVHSKAFTPQFLEILLASLYDHQVKTEQIPMKRVHNKAIFEQRGFFNILHTFREFKDRERWFNIGVNITSENLLAQTTSEGVQREWCGGYHQGVYNDALEISERVKDLGMQMPKYFMDRVELMADHIFGISTPELAFPMFGDTKRDKITSNDRRRWMLYNMLTEASDKFNNPKFRALAELDYTNLPTNGSISFPEAGLYAMRNRWSPDQVYMAVHCSPPAISTHDTPDNGTFELYAYGQWLMPDSGYYTYGHDLKARRWHRKTSIHATMTVNDLDINFAGRHLLWNSKKDADLLCVENSSYNQLLHRRTIWFAGKDESAPFFVIVDEAIGDIKGEITVRYPMAPGSINIDSTDKACYFNTLYDKVNLKGTVYSNKEININEEEGWHAWSYGKRERRKTVAVTHRGQAPLIYITVLLPYQGTQAPECTLLTDPKALLAGMNPIEIDLLIGGKKYNLSRSL